MPLKSILEAVKLTRLLKLICVITSILSTFDEI